MQKGEDSNAGKIRRFYTNNYSALDRFDRLWYEIVYPYPHRKWRVYFAWCVLNQALVNSYVAYMKETDKLIPIREFYSSVVDDFANEMAG